VLTGWTSWSQAHRTLKTALNHALARNHVVRNVAMIAKAPRIEEEEVEPYTIEEVQRLLVEADKRRNSARWAIALALGLRQGEVLGLKWKHVDLDAGELRVRRSRLRPKYAHGCGDAPPYYDRNTTCGRKAGYCPERKQINDDDAPTKSRAGRRGMGLPAEVVALLRLHRTKQDAEREDACQLWQEGGWVFTTPVGRPLSPNTDYHDWKDLLAAAGLRDSRLHDARHTAATVLLVVGTQQRAVMDVMGWSSGDMVQRYQHVTDPIRQDIAKRIGGALWKSAGTSEVE
jgi:integrase